MIERILKDQRSLLLLFLGAFTYYLVNYSGYGHSWREIILTSVSYVLTDYLLCRFYKKMEFSLASSAVALFGIFLVCDSSHLWMYALLAAIGAASRHFITNGEKHIFNPNNFGLVMGMLFLEDKINVVGGRWGGHPALLLFILILGIILIILNNKTPLVISFVFSFLIFGYIRSQLLYSTLTWVFMPLTMPTFFIFTFYMLTDPNTTPSSLGGQTLFGFLIAMLDGWFRFNQNKYSLFLALFIVGGLFPSLTLIFEWIVSKFRTQNLAPPEDPAKEE